jgi:hypothetical protein
MTSEPRLLRRHEQRVPISAQAQLREPFGRTGEARVANISPSGCMVETPHPLPLDGASIIVRLPGLQGLEAAVRWREDGKLGFEFSSRLHPAIVDHLAAVHKR